jgi:16S rRNA processing protein RimM
MGAAPPSRLPTEGGGEPILVGSIARAHGLTGEVVVDSFSDAPDRFAPGSVLTATAPSGKKFPVKITASRPFQARLLVRFEGVTNRTEAEALHGVDLTIDRSQVAPAPEGRLYRFELIGLEVKTRSGEPLGTLSDVFATGANDVYVVRGPRGEILLPSLPSVVLAIDLERRVMTVAPPPGLPGLEEG